MTTLELLEELDIFIKQNEDDFDRGKGKLLMQQFIESILQNPKAGSAEQKTLKIFTDND